MHKFIELTVVSDSADTSCTPRKASIRADKILSFVDVTSGNYSMKVKTTVVLDEPADYQNEADDAGGVIRSMRTLAVQENYETVKRLIGA